MSLTRKAAHDILDLAGVYSPEYGHPQLIARLRVLVGERDALKNEIERLQPIVAKLPKTADGVSVVPGMKVWVPADTAGYWGQPPGRAVEFMVDRIRSEATPLVLVSIQQGQAPRLLASRVFSTREAAEKWRE